MYSEMLTPEFLITSVVPVFLAKFIACTTSLLDCTSICDNMPLELVVQKKKKKVNRIQNLHKRVEHFLVCNLPVGRKRQGWSGS